MTLRCALYARYSSDQQRAASIEDQFRVCRERAEREGWKVVGCYKDSAISGDSVILRPGVQALLEDARRGAFEVLVAEALDRVSRDQADVRRSTSTALRRRDDRHPVGRRDQRAPCRAQGHDERAVPEGPRGEDAPGLRGRVEAGKSGGGLCYGYDVVKSFDGAGDPVRGGRTVNETRPKPCAGCSGSSPTARARARSRGG